MKYHQNQTAVFTCIHMHSPDCFKISEFFHWSKLSLATMTFHACHDGPGQRIWEGRPGKFWERWTAENKWFLIGQRGKPWGSLFEHCHVRNAKGMKIWSESHVSIRQALQYSYSYHMAHGSSMLLDKEEAWSTYLVQVGLCRGGTTKQPLAATRAAVRGCEWPLYEVAPSGRRWFRRKMWQKRRSWLKRRTWLLRRILCLKRRVWRENWTLVQRKSRLRRRAWLNKNTLIRNKGVLLRKNMIKREESD